MERDRTFEELEIDIAARVAAAVAPVKAAFEAMEQSHVEALAEQEAREVAIEKFAKAYAEGRLGADSDTVQ